MIGALIAQRRATRSLEALNRHDLTRYLQGWADDGVFVYPGTIPGISGSHVGKAAVRAFFQRLFEQFPMLQFTIRHVMVEKILGLGMNNVLAIHWDVVTENRQGRKGKTHGVSIVSLRRGKVIRVEDYLFDPGEQLAAAWGAGAAQPATLAREVAVP